MNNFRKVCLCFKSNICNYQIVICDGCKYWHFIINKPCQCVCICTNQFYLDLVANNYNTNLLFQLDITDNDFLDLELNFCKTEPVLYNFSLNDKNYGLPINGTLYFYNN